MTSCVDYRHLPVGTRRRIRLRFVRHAPFEIEPVSVEPPCRVRRPVMLQGWNDLAAVHWRYQVDEVQPLLPDGFAVDTFDGSAWVGLIPFQMNRIRIPKLPPLGRWSSFPETNVRTYIVDPQGRRGVWFFSLDINRLVPTFVARLTYRLPYCWSSMTIRSSSWRGVSHPGLAGSDGCETGSVSVEGSTWTYESRRRWPKGVAISSLAIQVGERIRPEDLTGLDHFLSARWALGTTLAGRLMWANVAHAPWVFHTAEVVKCDETLLLAAGLRSPSGKPIARWSRGVEVTIERPRIVRRCA